MPGIRRLVVLAFVSSLAVLGTSAARSVPATAVSAGPATVTSAAAATGPLACQTCWG